MKIRCAHLAAVLLVVAGCGADAATSTGSIVRPRAVADATVPSSAPVVAGTTSADPADLPDMALVSADGRIVSVRNGWVGAAVTGLVAADDATLIETSPSTATPGGTTVVWRRLSDGTEIGRTDLQGTLTAAATDLLGDVVALTRPNPHDSAATEIVIATRDGEAFRHVYDSELLPEGFSNAFTSNLPIGMFVIEYLEPPTKDPTAPRRYRVRVLDTATGELGLPLNLRDKSQQVDEDMLGFSRTHVTSPSNGLLFTLYRGLESDESQYAFVHTLGFVNGVWCLDLPGELWLERLPGALALSADETRLFVVSANGYITEFVIADITDPLHEPSPRRTEQAWSTAPNGGAPSLASGTGQLLVGQGSTLRWIDPATLTSTTMLDWDMAIEAVQLLDNADAVAAGSGRVSRISPTGDLIAEAILPADFGHVARIVLLDR